MKTLTRTLAFLTALASATLANAADIKVFCTNGVRAVVEELLPQFEKTTGAQGRHLVRAVDADQEADRRRRAVRRGRDDDDAHR